MCVHYWGNCRSPISKTREENDIPAKITSDFTTKWITNLKQTISELSQTILKEFLKILMEILTNRQGCCGITVSQNWLQYFSDSLHDWIAQPWAMHWVDLFWPHFWYQCIEMNDDLIMVMAASFTLLIQKACVDDGFGLISTNKYPIKISIWSWIEADTSHAY